MASKKTTADARPNAAPDDPSPSVRIQPIESLAFDPANPRAHGDRNNQTVRNSLRRFGAGRSIVLDGKDNIVAGNATIEGAIEEGFTEVLVVEPGPNQIVAVKRSGWSATEATGYAIADNRAAELATWDEDVFKRNVLALKEDGFDLDDAGWSDLELAPLFVDNGKLPDDADGKEFDEDVEKDVKLCECPECGHKFPP